MIFKQIVLYFSVFFLALFHSSMVFAADERNSVLIQDLMVNGKIKEVSTLLAPFQKGKDRISIIAVMQPSNEARALAEQSRQSTNTAQKMFVSGGPIFYDLKNETIKKRLRDTVIKTNTDFVATLDKENISIDRTFEYIFGFSADVTLAGMQQLIENEAVISIEQNRILTPHLAQGIPLMKASSARNTYNGSGISIAICDTGIDTSHPRLGGSSSVFNSKVIGGYDTGDNDADPRPGSSGDAHGTACAGISAGNLGTTGDYIGGVAPGARLYAIKISTGTSGSASDAAMIAGWEWCLTHKNDNPSSPILIISTSFGGGRYYSTCDSYSTSMTAAAANAVAAGITIFVSSGNDGYCDSMGWPACISYVNSVGAVYDAAFGIYQPCVNVGSCASKYFTGECPTGFYAIDSTAPNKVTSYSNSASFLSMFAPANNAYTTDITGSGGYTSSFGGTSAACPYAAGAAAVLQHAAKSITGHYLTPWQVSSYLKNNGDTVTDSKIAISKPRINLARTIAALGNPPLSSNFPWNMMLTPILTSVKPSDPLWGADNNVCCGIGYYTFALTNSGITKRATNQSCTSSTTWEGWVTSTKGSKKFDWITYGACNSFSGSFNYTLFPGKNYLFWAKWNVSTVEVWVSIYNADPELKDSVPGERQPIAKELISVVPIPAAPSNQGLTTLLPQNTK